MSYKSKQLFWDKLKELGYNNYSHYLQSNHWKKFSNAIRKESCYCCGSTKSKTHVHHINYDNIGAERADDVVSVCNICHFKIHKHLEKQKSVPLEEAHILHAKLLHQQASSQKNFGWVPRSKLVGQTTLHKTLEEVTGFLLSKGLIKLGVANGLAHELNFAKTIEGQECWNVVKYVKLCASHKTLLRAILRAKFVLPHFYKNAMEPVPAHAYDALKQYKVDKDKRQTRRKIEKEEILKYRLTKKTKKSKKRVYRQDLRRDNHDRSR